MLPFINIPKYQNFVDDSRTNPQIKKLHKVPWQFTTLFTDERDYVLTESDASDADSSTDEVSSATTSESGNEYDAETNTLALRNKRFLNGRSSIKRKSINKGSIGLTKISEGNVYWGHTDVTLEAAYRYID